MDQPTGQAILVVGWLVNQTVKRDQQGGKYLQGSQDRGMPIRYDRTSTPPAPAQSAKDDVAMTLHNLPAVLATMDEMIDLELTISALYAACGDAFPEDPELWRTLAQQERQHAEFIARLKTLTAEHAQDFALGRPFNATAIRTLKSGISTHIEHLRQGHVSRQTILFICRDLEKSILEANYRAFVTSTNVEFRTLSETIARQTLAHQHLLEEQITKGKG